MTNPFKTYSNLIRVEFKTKILDLELFEMEIEEIVASFFEDIINQKFVLYLDECNFNKLKKIFFKYKINNLEIFKEDNQDWVSDIQNSFEKVIAGKFLISPKEEDQDIDYIKLHILPFNAFGTGEHPTTRGCLELLSEVDKMPNIILDVGSGSGILSIASKKLFPNSNVYATEIDEGSIIHAKKNFELNKTDVLISQHYNLNNLYNKVDLIVANILLSPLIEMCKDFSQMINDDGKIIISGINESQFEELQEVFSLNNLTLEKYKNIDGWISAMFVKKITI